MLERGGAQPMVCIEGQHEQQLDAQRPEVELLGVLAKDTSCMICMQFDIVEII